MHEMEWEYARTFAIDQKKFDDIWKKNYGAKK
jgi:diphthine synthase